MINITVSGRLGRDAELRYITSGQAVASFSVASDRIYTNQDGGKVKETTWVRCTLWGKIAESLSKYLVKGKFVTLTGRPVVDIATGSPKIFTRQDGSMGTSLEVNVSEIELGPGGSNGSGDDGAAEANTITTDEEIPF